MKFLYKMIEWQDIYAEGADGKMIGDLAEAQLERALPELGEDGWELVSIISKKNISGFAAVFKKTVKPTPPPILTKETRAMLQKVKDGGESLVVGPANPSGDPVIKS